MIRPLLFAILAAAALSSAAPRAAAQTITWDANGAVPPDGVFGVAANWDPDLVPTVGDTAIFNINDTYTVTLDANAAMDVLDVDAGDVSLVSDSATVRTIDLLTGAEDVEVRGGTLRVGANGMPVDLNVGAQLGIGNGSGEKSGTLIVSGTNSRLDASGPTTHSLGLFGQTGTLTFENTSQGTVDAQMNLGVSTVTSQGNLNVLSDADVTIASLNVASIDSSATGNVTVDGTGSTLTQSGASTLSVGSAVQGAGTLDVTGSGTFNSGTGAIAVGTTGAINIDTGGTFNANGPMTFDDGTINRGSTGNFDLGSGLTLTALNDAQIDIAGDYDLDAGTTFDLSNSADLAVGQSFDIGSSFAGGGG